MFEEWKHIDKKIVRIVSIRETKVSCFETYGKNRIFFYFSSTIEVGDEWHTDESDISLQAALIEAWRVRLT